MATEGGWETGTWAYVTKYYWVNMKFLGGANSVPVLCGRMALGDSDETLSKVLWCPQLTFRWLRKKSRVHISICPQHGKT